MIELRKIWMNHIAREIMNQNRKACLPISKYFVIISLNRIYFLIYPDNRYEYKLKHCQTKHGVTPDIAVKLRRVGRSTHQSSQ